jgi:predicted phage baseplate assembly protein
VDQIDGPVVFETNNAVTLPDNTNGNAANVYVGVTEGTTRSGVLLGTSDGTPGQVFSVPNSGVYRDTINIYIEDPSGSIILQPEGGGATVNVQQWLQVPRLLGTTSSKVFEARPSASVAVVLFGDDLSGAIPATGLRVFATYRYGVGQWGNVPAGAIRNVDTTSATGIDAVKVYTSGVGVYSSLPTKGGADEESDKSIRENAPLAYRAQDRVVTAEDYVSVAVGTPGVAKASAVIGSYTAVTVYVAGSSNMALSGAAMQGVYDRLRERVLAGVTVGVYPFTGSTVNFGTVADPMVIKVRAGYPPSVVDDAVRRAIISLMDDLPANTALTASAVYTAVAGVDGVQSAFIPVITRATGATQTDTTPITPWPWELLTVGQVNITLT